MPEHANHFVLESCEFQRHFLAYHPDYAIITNIELDHIDYYKDMDDYVSASKVLRTKSKKALSSLEMMNTLKIYTTMCQ